MSEDVEMTDIDMGYEEAAPMPRRGSMSQEEEKERRASIKAIMADDTISPMAKRRSIQHLMDGRRNSLENARRNSLENARRSSMSGAIAVPTNHSTSAHSYHSTGSSAGDAHEFENGGGSGDYPYPNNVPFGENGNMQQYGYDDTSQLPNANGVFAISNEFTRRTEQTRPYCSHYERNCTIIAPCCGAAFGCRICHDDCPVLPPKINNGGKRYHRSASLPSSFTDMGPKEDPVDPNETHHNIDRFAIREVICRECFTRQSSKTNQCVSCGVAFGAYHCGICNLWMSDEEEPYHCEQCGFCRVGGAQNFKHCNDCGMCIDRSLYDNHNCKAGKYRSNCPVCQEYLFSSRSASHEMPCGHAIHWACFKQLAAHDSRCPVCKKTAENPGAYASHLECHGGRCGVAAGPQGTLSRGQHYVQRLRKE